MHEKVLATIIFVILPWFQNRDILMRDKKKGLAFVFGCEPKPETSYSTSVQQTTETICVAI